MAENRDTGLAGRKRGVVARAVSGAGRALTAAQFSELRSQLVHEIERLYKEGQSVEEWRFQELKAVDEWRFSDLKTADEWRFRDLKSHIDDRVSQDTQFALEQSVKEIAKLGDSRRMAVAVVSIYPPVDSGIATFTANTFAAFGRPIDVYTPINSGFEYLAMRMQTRGETISNIFSASALPAGLEQRNYAAVVFVVGNSNHFVPIARLLRTLRHYRRATHFALEVHDPILLNLCAQVSLTKGLRLSDVLPQHAKADLSKIDWRKADAGDHAELVAHKVGGVRALFNDAPISSLVVHSAAARDLIIEDWPDFPPERVKVLFHPIFDRFDEERAASAPRSDVAVRIGTFGVPGASKQTDTIIEAFKQIAEQRPGSTLTIAGFDADIYAAGSEAMRGRRDIVVVDSPPHEKLLQLMQGCDIAVQLRVNNTGESSGVVPQLLAHDVPTICSQIGSFADYGPAVSFVAPGCTAAELAQTILGEVADPAKRREARRSFVLERSPRHFCDELFAFIGKLEGRDGDQEPAEAADVRGSTPVGAEPAGETDEPFWNDFEPQPKSWPRFMEIATETGAVKDPYVQGHLLRYRHTLAAMDALDLPVGASGLEIGTSWLFAPALKESFGFNRVDVTDFDPGDERKVSRKTVKLAGSELSFSAFNINLEHDAFPAEDEAYDFVLCCEVLEHMDIDPMFMMSEINRVCRIGAKLLMTTPNVCSSRNVQKILAGYAPHFYMQYHKDRSPYRHNLEYAPDQARAVVAAAGFEIEQHWTANTFEPMSRDTIAFLKAQGFPTDMRGDNMFLVARKVGPVVDRHPPAVYV